MNSFSAGDGAANMDEAVTVCVRCKPIAPLDGRMGPGQRKVVNVYQDESQICVVNPKAASGVGNGGSSSSSGAGDKHFAFDAVMDENTSQVGCPRVQQAAYIWN